MASPNQSRRSRVIEGMAIWGSYYRENIDIFVEEYLQLDFLKWFQTALLVMMDRSRTFLWIAARGMGKSFLIAIFVVIRCILYPGTKVVITSGTRGQSINVLEKIQTELMPVSPNTFTLSWSAAIRIGLATGRLLTRVSVRCTDRFACSNPLLHATVRRANQLIKTLTRLILCLAV